MKTIKLFLTILISFFIFTNNVKADIIYDCDTIPEQDIIVACIGDTLNFYHSSYPNPYQWGFDGNFYQNSPYIKVTNNCIIYTEDGTNWDTTYTNTNGYWTLFKFNSVGGSQHFYIYFNSPPSEPWTLTSENVCGASDTLYSGHYEMGTYYTWYKDGILESEGYYPSDTSKTIWSSGQYVVQIETGCDIVRDTIDITLVDNTLPYIGPDMTVCGNGGVNEILQVNPPFVYDSYLWSTGETTNEIIVTSPGTYWVEVNNACLTGVRDSIVITETYYEPLNLGADTVYICPGSDITINMNFEYNTMLWTYDWSSSTILSTDSFLNITPTQDTTILAYARSGSCPSMADSVRVVLTQPYDNNNLCVVTVDTSGFNKVVWDKKIGEGISSYNIYRLASNYELIGTVSIDDEPVFYDTESNPMTSANRYKISAVDTCGNESDLSTYHGTIHITVSPSYPTGIDLTITDEYLDESGTYIPESYNVLIDSLNDGNYTIIDNLNAVFSSYHIDNPLPGATYLLSVEMPWDCTGAKSSTMSYSNKTVEITTDVSSNYTSNITVYPNPSQGVFTVLGIGIERIVISDITGRILLEKAISTNRFEFDLSEYPKAMYLLKMETNYGVQTKKVFVE